MYAITGITGKVGGALARHLLAAGERVRAVARNPASAQVWSAQGCEVAMAEMHDADALTAAFAGAEGVFVLPPPVYDPAPGFPETRACAEALAQALRNPRPARVVCLSTVGAQAAEENLLSQLGLMERTLAMLALPITFLRPAWYMDNFAWDLETVRQSGVLHSFLQPLERAIPMVASADVGRVAAELIRQPHDGVRRVALEGPRPVSPLDAAAAFSAVLGRPVRVETVPRADWDAQFRAQGMRHPEPRMRMLDGFNQGWIRFEDEPRLRGELDLVAVLQGLLGTD
ncbi:MAG: NmrA family transcriptional regulator [Pseudoxanthomonas spadix]|nr:MAG: NmrA family transcriptional regulator [Pseudoxanthomonas spadix]